MSEGKKDVVELGVFISYILVAIIAYFIGRSNGTLGAERYAAQHLSAVEDTFHQSENLPPTCETLWEDAKAIEKDFKYEPERDDDPWSDPP